MRSGKTEKPAWLAGALDSVVSTAMVEQEVYPSVWQRVVIKCLTNEGVKPSKVFIYLKSQNQMTSERLTWRKAIQKH